MSHWDAPGDGCHLLGGYWGGGVGVEKHFWDKSVTCVSFSQLMVQGVTRVDVGWLWSFSDRWRKLEKQ